MKSSHAPADASGQKPDDAEQQSPARNSRKQPPIAPEYDSKIPKQTTYYSRCWYTLFLTVARTTQYFCAATMSHTPFIILKCIRFLELRDALHLAVAVADLTLTVSNDRATLLNYF